MTSFWSAGLMCATFAMAAMVTVSVIGRYGFAAPVPEPVGFIEVEVLGPVQYGRPAQQAAPPQVEEEPEQQPQPTPQQPAQPTSPRQSRDVNLPDQNGMALCRSLKREGGMRAPVLFLTARGSLDDKLAAFAAGAVDYMVKPFAPAELLARARAITTHTAHVGGPQLRVGAYVLDIQRHLLARGDDSLPLHGTGLVLMRALMEASPGSVSRQVLCERLWQGDPPDSDPLRMHVYQLRQHCLRAFGVPLIANVRGVGYRFSGEPMDAPA